VTQVAKAFSDYFNKLVYKPPQAGQTDVTYFDDNEVVGILGDWGTGLQDANDLLDHLVKVEKATIILHNGDVYYAGFPEEFLRINVKITELQKEYKNLKYLALPGNHDYYTWGGPFYNHLPGNNSGQQLALFCLRNKG
jgi:3',5'-cyclic AMP phosphodiesterase CpdA